MGPILWRLWLRANAQHSTRIHTLTDVHCLQANASCTAPVHLYTYSYPPSSCWGLSRKTKSTHCVPQQAVTCVNKGLSCLEQRCVPSWTKVCALLNKGLWALLNKGLWALLNKGLWALLNKGFWALLNKDLGALLNEGMWALLNKGWSPLECAGSLLK